MAFINATIGRALAPIASTGHAYPYFRGIFHRQIVEKSLSCPNNNRCVTHQTDEKHLNKMSDYFVGVVNIVFNRYNNHIL